MGRSRKGKQEEKWEGKQEEKWGGGKKRSERGSQKKSGGGGRKKEEKGRGFVRKEVAYTSCIARFVCHLFKEISYLTPNVSVCFSSEITFQTCNVTADRNYSKCSTFHNHNGGEVVLMLLTITDLNMDISC